MTKGDSSPPGVVWFVGAHLGIGDEAIYNASRMLRSTSTTGRAVAVLVVVALVGGCAGSTQNVRSLNRYASERPTSYSPKTA